jgi:hypothetical protein
LLDTAWPFGGVVVASVEERQSGAARNLIEGHKGETRTARILISNRLLLRARTATTFA